MQTSYVLALADASATLENVGGKGMSLAKMANAGLPIPNGFHITTTAYCTFVEANHLQMKILSALKDVDTTIPAALETASKTIGSFFAESKIPKDISNAICNAYLTLDASHPSTSLRTGVTLPVAVRSSATAEDLPEASFAGQQETYLNIHGEEALLDAVKKCWASLWTARAIAYRIKNNIDQNTVALAVVVQEMVNAEAAGILFTANPMNGHRDEMVINAAWGLGEAIVGGLVSPDTIVADKATGKVKQMDVAEKTVITVETENGTEEKPLNDSRRSSQVMKEAQVSELVKIARQIESYYGKPQDIEWCRTNGNFYIVQSRPITALPPEPVQWILPKPKLMLARGSLAEHLPNAVSPLFGTLGLRPVNKATAELSDLMGGNLDFLAAEYQYRVINGYVYFGFLMSAKFMWSMIKITFASTKFMFTQSKERWLEAREIFKNAVAEWENKNVENLSPSELLDGARQLMYAAGKFYTVVQSSTLPTTSSSEIFFTRIYKMISRKDDPKAETLLFGLETVALRAEKSLFDLGMWIRERPALRDFMLHASRPTEKLVAALQADSTPETIPAEDWRELKARLAKHLDQFGHTSYEFDFMNPTPAETPELILDAIKMYAEGKGSDPYARQREVNEKREQALQKIRSRFKLIPNRWFNKAFNWAIDTAPTREDSLADMGMGHTTVRRMLGELGRRLTVNHVIEGAEDIYWLVEDEVNELASMLEQSGKLPNYSDKVSARKAEWREQMKLIPPAMLPTTSRWAKLVPWGQGNETGNTIKGLGASAGKVTAKACVMFTPEDFHKMKTGDVLVAVTTTPAWTPLFTLASAVVTDIGGPLSHSSIVAREYGIPAVLATGVGTRRIQDGQTITVNGTKGEVILETGKEDQTEQSAPPLEWRRFNLKAVYARGSLAEHLPNAVSPLFGTLGIRAVNKATGELSDLMNINVLEAEYQYRVINGYVYMGFLLNLKFSLAMARLAFTGLKFMFTGGRERWLEARRTLADVIAKWDEKNHTTLSPSEILEGARELTYAAGKYYTLIQSGTLPSASSSEIIFTSVYKLVKRKDDPDAPTLLFGLETVPLRAEKSLFDLGMWIRERPALRDFTLQTLTVKLVAALQADSYPDTVPAQEWEEFKSRLDKHFDQFGHTSYEFDFMNPTPAETPELIIEAVKAYVAGKGSDPYQRQREVTEKREQTLQKIRSRFKLIPNRWFNKSFQWAIDTGPAREDSLADLGMGHTTIRRLLGELGKRFVANGALKNAEDIYWLVEDEADNLASLLERGEHLPDHTELVSERKATWHQQMKLVPPAVIPQNSSWAKVFPWSKENASGNVIKGLGASAGKVTATARLLFSPEDFNKMKQGDVLVAVTTTPAWTPLFTLASAVVTDIGGPLSHSSIVAREYGIPAVLATGVGTRRIIDGQTIIVDGSTGTVSLLN